MNGKIGLRIVSALVLIAAIAGIGFFAFRAGVAQGSPITIEAPRANLPLCRIRSTGMDMGCASTTHLGLDSDASAFSSRSSSSCSR